MATKLKKLGFNASMIKEFATLHNLAENTELLSLLLEDEKKLINLIEDFEK